MTRLRQRFHFEPDAEVGDRGRSAPADGQRWLAALGQNGVTRASLGVQTFDPAVQEAVARVQSLETTQNCAKLLRDAGIKDLNVDLLYGLPHETVDSGLETVDGALSLNPARLAVFGYAHVPGIMKHQKV